MRLDHIAYRVADRKKTADFFMKSFGYHVQTEFEINFDDGSSAGCLVLEPPEKEITGGRRGLYMRPSAAWSLSTICRRKFLSPTAISARSWANGLPPVVGLGAFITWRTRSIRSRKRCAKRRKGFAEFSTDDVIRCPDLVQVFTKPSQLTGVIYEFIERGKHGFCADNVKNLMTSTKDFR